MYAHRSNISTPASKQSKAAFAIVFIKVCPAIIFAKRRTAKLTKRNEYEITSIGIIKNTSIAGQPAGIKWPKK